MLLVLLCTLLLGQAQASPTLNETTAPAQGIMVCNYVPMNLLFTSHLSHPGSQDPCMPSNTQCILVYIDVVHVRDCQDRSTHLP